MDDPEVKRLHAAMRFLEMPATTTSLGFLKLVEELERAGILDEAAVERIKTAMYKELCLRLPAHLRTQFFESMVREHLNRLFSGDEPLATRTYQAPQAPPPQR
jgi:hypothetical protein